MIIVTMMIVTNKSLLLASPRLLLVLVSSPRLQLHEHNTTSLSPPRRLLSSVLSPCSRLKPLSPQSHLISPQPNRTGLHSLGCWFTIHHDDDHDHRPNQLPVRVD